MFYILNMLHVFFLFLASSTCMNATRLIPESGRLEWTSTGLALLYSCLGNQIILWWGQTQKVKYVRGSILTYPWYMFSTCIYLYLVTCNHGFKDIICVFSIYSLATYYIFRFFVPMYIYIYLFLHIYIDRICTYLKYIIFNRYFF